jgi:intracellular multiplication protein IcmO
MSEKTLNISKTKIEEISIKEFVKKSVPLKMGMALGVLSPFIGYFTENANLGIAASLISIPSLVLSRHLFSNDFKETKGLIPNEKDKKYFTNAGYIVKEHSPKGAYYDTVKEIKSIFSKKIKRVPNSENIESPLLIDETTLRTHMLISGTTGSGKTVFVKSIMKQLLSSNGSGFMMIEGKGDNTMFHEIYAEVIMAKREKDFYFLNFIDKYNSNTINILEIGDYDSIKDSVIDFIIAGKQEDVWSDKGKNLMTAFLKPLIILRDADLIFDVSKSKEINNIEDIKKYKKKLSLPLLKELTLTPERMFEFCLALDRIYDNDKEKFAEQLKTYRLSEGEILTNYLKSSDIPQIHKICEDILLQLVKELGSWEKIKELGSWEKVNETLSSGEVLYDLDVAKGFFTSLFTTFGDTFGEIFSVEEGDINIEDIIVNGKILHCPLQGINPTMATAIANVLLSLIRSVAKKRSKENSLLFPFVIFCDEFNSWSAGVKGFGDLLSVTRSYGMSFCIMHQSDLGKIDDGKGIEKGQILANINTLFLLKVADTAVVEEYNKLLGEEEYYEKDMKEEYDSKQEGIKIDNKYSKSTRKYLDPKEVKGLESGQGYVITKGGEVKKFVSSYLPDTTVFEPITKNDIPKITLINKEKLYEKIEEIYQLEKNKKSKSI